MEKSQPPPCPGVLHHRCGGAKVMDPWSHPSPGPLPGDPGPLKDRSRASSSPPRCPFSDYSHVFPSSGFPRLNTLQAFSLSPFPGGGIFGIHSSPAWVVGAPTAQTMRRQVGGGTQGCCTWGVGAQGAPKLVIPRCFSS